MKNQKRPFIFVCVFLSLCTFCLSLAVAQEQNGEAALYRSVETWETDDPGRAGSAVYTYYIPYFLADSDYWTGVGLRNGSGTASASVTVYGMSDGGSVLGSQTKSIPAEGQTAFMMNPGEGWVKVSSDQPLTGLGFVAMVHDDKLMFDIPFVSQPATTLYIPHVAQDATWDTTVFVCNPNGSQSTMYLTFFDAAGTVVKVSQGYILPANGSGKYPLSVFLGASASYDKGSIRITATQGVAAFALYHNLKTGDRSYAGISAMVPETPGLGSYTYYIPYFLADSDYWTGAGLRNGSGTASASVTVYGMSDGGSVLGSQTKTIPAEGQTAFMMNPGEGWVKVSSDQPLTGLGFVAMVHDDKLMFDIPFVSQPATTLYIPHVAQDATWDTTVFVCNPNGSQTTMYLTFFDATGMVVKVSQGYILPANGSGKYPLSVFLGASASYDKGSVQITATQGVAAFALYHNLKTGDRSYAGISAVAPDASTACTYSLSPTSASVSASGGTGTVAVTAAAGCPWTAVSNNSWLDVTAGPSGTGSGTVSYSVESYSGTGNRTGTLTIAGETFTVTQTDCSFSISPATASFTGDGGTGSVAVATSPSTCSWTAASNNSWLHVTAGSSGTGNGTVSYSVDTYTRSYTPLPSNRTGTLTIAGKTFTVTQSCKLVALCSYSISPTSKSFTGDGGTGKVDVTVTSSGLVKCPSWTATSNATWLQVTSPLTSVTGSGTVSYSVDPYTSTHWPLPTRTGTLTIAGKAFTVTQTAKFAFIKCFYSISPESKTFLAGGGTSTVAVSATAGCTWTAVSNNTSWLHVTSGSSGTGNGTVYYSVDSLPMLVSSRTGTITIAGKTFTVSQTRFVKM